jgi:hypothetical protein
VRPRLRRILAAHSAIVLAAGASSACRESRGSAAAGAASASASASASPRSLSSIVVDHGELDTHAPDDSLKIAVTVIAATVYKEPNLQSRRLGYVRLGGSLRRDPEPVPGKGCKEEWYRVYPTGYMCADEATVDLEAPLVRAASKRPDLDKPLPYDYGPTRKEQTDSEFKLDEHLAWYAEHRAEVQTVIPGANDVALDERGVPRPGLKPAAGFRASTALSENELFGGDGADDPRPFWLANGRSIPNVSGFDVPESSIFADRVRRKTGLSFVGAFQTEDAGLVRRFAVTVDLRLIPTTKVKPDTGSPFHGIEVNEDFPFPLA